MTTETAVCKPCQITRLAPMHPFFSLGCLHCGARIIQRLGVLPIAREQITARRRENLAHWVAFGHSEAKIRALAKQDALAVAPHTQATPAASARPTTLKPR